MAGFRRDGHIFHFLEDNQVMMKQPCPTNEILVIEITGLEYSKK